MKICQDPLHQHPGHIGVNRIIEQSGNQKWVTSKQLLKDFKDGKKRYLHKFFNTWNEVKNYDIGWLSGMFDGEGYCSGKVKKGVRCGITQRSGNILNKISRILNELNINYSSIKTGNKNKDIITYQIKGGLTEISKLFGIIRPERLIEKFENLLFTGELAYQLSAINKCEVINVRELKDDWVCGIET